MTVPRMSNAHPHRLPSPAEAEHKPSRARLRFSQRAAAERLPAQKPLRGVGFLMIFTAALFGFCFWVFGKLSPQLAWTQTDFSAPQGQDWPRQTVVLSRSKKLRRQLILYRQDESAPNWRMEFTWNSDPAGIGLIVRSLDARNYSAVRLRRTADGVSEESFHVIDGVEGRHSRKSIVFPRPARDLPVMVEENGPEVTLRLHYEIVDQWAEKERTPDRIGFFEESGDKLAARSVRISHAPEWSSAAVSAAAVRTLQAWWSSLRLPQF